MKTPPAIIKKSAVWDGKHYNHFGIHPMTARIYGHDVSEIVEVTLKISENQELAESSHANLNTDYWGWFDYKTERFTLVFPHRILLGVCFPYGIKAEEEYNRGKSYRLEVVENKIPKK